MADPVAWTLIEHGWAVIDAEGNEIGKVVEVTGDHNVDIFDGLAVGGGVLSEEKYVPSEQVGAIVEGAVHITVRADDLDRYTAPPAEERILPESSRWYQRLGERLFGDSRKR
jgi:uncharacterized protein YrrD